MLGSKRNSCYSEVYCSEETITLFEHPKERTQKARKTAFKVFFPTGKFAFWCWYQNTAKIMEGNFETSKFSWIMTSYRRNYTSNALESFFEHFKIEKIQNSKKNHSFD